MTEAAERGTFGDAKLGRNLCHSGTGSIVVAGTLPTLDTAHVKQLAERLPPLVRGQVPSH